jgi:hypothetical protein
MTRTAQKTKPITILWCRGKLFTKLLPSNSRGMHRQIHRRRSKTVLLLLLVFVAVGTCLPSLCLATIGGIHIQTQRMMTGILVVCLWDGLRCYGIYIPSFIKIGSGILKLIGGRRFVNIQTQTAWRSHKPSFIFLKQGKYAKDGDSYELYTRILFQYLFVRYFTKQRRALKNCRKQCLESNVELLLNMLYVFDRLCTCKS